LSQISGTFTNNGSSAVVDYVTFATVAASGTWGSGTLSVETTYDNGTTWIPSDVTTQLSANGQFNFMISGGPKIRLTLAGATSPNLKYWLNY